MGDATATKEATPPVDWKHPDSAVRHPLAHFRLWGLAAIGLAVDLWSKSWAFRELDPGAKQTAIPGLLDFQLSLNPGALFGMGTGMVTLFIVASVAALLFVFYLFTGTTRRQYMLHVALALILAGALGNLYDRSVHQFDLVYFEGVDRPLLGEVVAGESQGDVIAVRPWYDSDRLIHHRRDELAGPVQQVGVVRDFLKIVPQVGGREIWPWIFNVADICLVIGVILLLLSYWSRGRHDASPADGHDAPSNAASP